MRKILVVGDTIIDRNVYVEATGLSLETPTIKGNFLHQEDLLGGAANLVSHLRIFGCECTFMTSVSPDRSLHNVINLFCDKENIKTRFWVKKGDEEYKILQINSVNTDPIPCIESIDEDYDLIIVSDYRCGLLSTDLISLLRKLPGKKIIASQVSDKQPNFFMYDGFDEIVLNEKEYELLDTSFNRVHVTMGEKGSMIIERTKDGETKKTFSAYPVNVKNTVGAGDAFYGALLATDDHDTANKWASYVVSKKFGDKITFEECFMK